MSSSFETPEVEKTAFPQVRQSTHSASRWSASPTLPEVAPYPLTELSRLHAVQAVNLQIEQHILLVGRRETVAAKRNGRNSLLNGGKYLDIARSDSDWAGHGRGG